MSLSNDLLSQFAKLTKQKKETNTDTIVYGESVVVDGITFVKIDGSDLLTPVSSTTDVQNGERVIVMIKDHTATITGNMSPEGQSARKQDVQNNAENIAEFDVIVSYKVTTDDLSAINATIDNLKSKTASIEHLETVIADIELLQAKYAVLETVSAKDAEILNAEIENLRAKYAEFTDISAEDLQAIYADIDNLIAYNANFTYLSAEVLKATKAAIDNLNAEKLDVTWANIDFANIDKATLNEIYARSGLIRDVYTDNATVTGYLVGVTIRGDLIEAGTLKADKLVLLGEDGIYYKLNFNQGTFAEGEPVPTDSLHGSIITKGSIVAEKISVSDLIAFDATIGSFKIGANSIYSAGKESADSSIRGIYMDTDGQWSIGDSNNYLKYYKTKDENGNDVFKMEIAADSILFGANTKSSLDAIRAITERVKIGTYIDPVTENEKPSIELAEDDTKFKLRLTNSDATFMDGDKEGTIIDTEGITTENVNVKNEFRMGPFVWFIQENGNLALTK